MTTKVCKKRLVSDDVQDKYKYLCDMEEVHTEITSDNINSLNKIRIGSPSMHAEVYKYKCVAIKLCPATLVSKNEIKYLGKFTNLTIKTNLQHFPVMFDMLRVRDIIYEQSRIPLQALFSLVVENVPVGLPFIRKYFQNLPNKTAQQLSYMKLVSKDDVSNTILAKALKSIETTLDPATEITNIMSIAMIVELADCDLRILLSEHKLRPSQLANILMQVCMALTTLNDYELFHGDLHAGNILIKHLEPCLLEYETPKVYRLNKVEYYVILWDFETMGEKDADITQSGAKSETNNVLEDIRRLFDSLNTTSDILEKQSNPTKSLIRHMDGNKWNSIDEIVEYIQTLL